MNAPTRSPAFWMACALMWSTGCTGPQGAADREPTVPVSGTVTYKGDPVADAAVSLIPELPPGTFPGQSSMKGAFARTDSSGRFELMTYEAGDGAIPGKYKVTVSKYEGQPIEAEPSEEEYDELPEGYVPPPRRSLLPEQYSNIRATPLQAEVKLGEPLTLNLELQD